MFGRRYFPPAYGTSPGLYAPALFNPFRGLLGGSLMIAGVIVILNMIAPQILEHTLPDWKLRYGGIIVAGVVLGFLRSIFRMFLPLVALGFWMIAMFAVFHTSSPTRLSLPNFPSISAHTPSVSATPTVVTKTPQRLHGSPALPESAYYRTQPSEGLGALSKVPGVSWIKKLLR
jgi:hypothetical protein